ncbi:S8 family serine peptidase [Carboxylicivirga mesophila]|uniref:S8 family serine peptidase n=1 Tax=Carboxylicivirga mesophila TaxID=1166478 RepID=A0ABS5KGJ3_9BACT|nr:S8 family serine peptidase [Carboxylicivirga mesophila]MBS2213957.1 S8 family serine peptidase [Carboxylicivirga mesophila]
MNKITLHHRRFFLVVVSFLMVIGGLAQELKQFEKGIQKGVIKVKLKPELIVSPQGLKSQLIDGVAQTGILSIDRLNIDNKAHKMERVFPYSPKYEARHQKHGLHLWYRIELDENADIQSVISSYAKASEVQVAEPYYETQLVPYSITLLDETSKAALKATQAAPFNDPILPDQWHYHNTGAGDVTTGADINLYKAWERQVGQSNVIVSIHDEGVQYAHEDLAANMWVNEAELNGEEGVDDDGNGYVDDIYGYNFITRNGTIAPNHHGTHVAGTVAAVNNNGIGVGGVAGGTGIGDGARIMACQIIGEGPYNDIAASFVYAADMGAVISQNSWGWTTDGHYEQSVKEAIDYFVAEAGNYEGSPMKGGIVVCASGNSASDGLHYPAAFESTIAVSATGPENIITDYSNFGAYIDITAPGGDNSYGEEFGVLSTVNYDGYAFLDGTSMACPHVSGVAALVVSEHGGSDFTVNDLKVHLLGGTNVIDTITGNENYVGLMGVGATDADLALRKDNGISPKQITNLELTGVSQDFASLKWTVPTDEDDDKATFFEVYYATSYFDDASIEDVSMVLIKNVQDENTVFSYELNGLESTTEYFIAVKALDRWGNASSLSNLVNGTTNEGPEVEFSVPEVIFNIDVNVAKDASSVFELRNIGEGVLKWEVQQRHVRNEDTYAVNSINYPQINTVSKLPDLRSAPFTNTGGEIVPYAQKPVNNDDIFYFHPDYLLYSMTTLGDMDMDYTNSMATRFELTREQGFNMTHFEFALNLPDIEETPMEEPIILELYKGEELSSAQRIYAQEYMPIENRIWHFVELTEQIFFESGDIFFLVVHTPSKLRYPLIASWGWHPSFADYQFYSNNLGKKWDKLKDIFSPDYVWDVAAWSMYEPLDTYLKLTPANGILQARTKEDITVELDASKLINGDYQAKLAFLTNETGKEINYLPVNFTVTGNKPVLESEQVLEFGNIFVGESKEMTIEIYNSGLGAFAGDELSSLDVQVSNADFQLSSNVAKVIYAERSTTLSFRYWPKQAGASNAAVTLTDKVGNQYRFNLFGVGINPPAATVEPSVASFDGLNLGDVVNGSFTLRNDGEYPLTYYVPKFADGSNLNKNTSGLVHLFGYAAGQVEGDATTNAFEWIDISTTGTEVGHQFASNSKVTYIDAPIGFDFPFFEGKEDTVFITKQGALSFTTEGWFNSQPVMYGNVTQPDKLICAYGLEMDLSKSGAIYYQKYPDRFVTQYDKIYAMYLDDNFVVHYTSVTFQIVLFINGDIEIYYKDMGAIPYGDIAILGYRNSMQVSIYDETLKDGILLNGYIKPNSGFMIDERLKDDMPPTTGYMMYFRYPGLGSVQSVSNPYGTLQVGESIQLDYVLDTKDLYVSDFVERINVISNDPNNNPAVHSMNLNIISGGEVDYQYNVEAIDFAEVFQRDNVSRTFAITNKGRAIGTIESISLKNGYYTAEGYLPVELIPNSRVEYTITINSTEMGNKDDVLVFTDSFGSIYEVPVYGTVIEAPIISTVVTELSQTINHGDVITNTLTIDNTGKSPMLISPVGNEWISIMEEGYTGQSANVSYDMTFIELGGSSYDNWIDIRETGRKLEEGDMFEPSLFWRIEKLPFEFEFFGEMQDTLYISYNGMITFDKHDEIFSFGPNQLIPHADVPNNFIAPLWGPIGPAFLEYYPTTGTYYQEYADKVVILFQDYMNLFSMGYPVSFEVLIYKNGNIKFLYHFPWEEATTQWCVAGIENKDGTKGYSPSQFVANLIKDGSVITFVPVEEYEIAASSSKHFDLVYDARSIYGGTYQETLYLTNNTPDAPDYNLPVTMTVIGDKKIELHDTLEFDELFIYDEISEVDGSTQPKVYDMNFTLNNVGTEKILLSFMRLKDRATGLTVMGSQAQWGSSAADDPWIDISRKNLNYYLKPGNSETFNLRIIPESPADVIDTILVTTDMPGGIYKIPVSAIYTHPPVINIQSEGIVVTSNTADEIIERSVTIDNLAGKAELTYSIDFEFERSSGQDVLTNAKTLSAHSTALTPAIQSTDFNSLKSTNLEGLERVDYNRILEHDNFDAPTGMIGFGGGAWFYTATAFWAPADGFNLTHAMSWIGWGEAVDAVVEVMVYGGAETIFDAELLHTESFTLSESDPSDEGRFMTFELSKNLLFYPNEKFYIVFRYDKALNYPQGKVDVEEPVEHRYYFGNDEAMFELVENGYESMGWLMKAAEKDYSSNIWAVLTSDPLDTIQPGNEIAIDLKFIAKYAEQGINVAHMVVKSNDPVTPVAKMPVTLSRNKGPQFEGGKSVYYAINEGDTLHHTIVAYDDEGDDFTLQLKKDYEYVSAIINDKKMEVIFEADYEAAGIHQVVVEGIDSYGNESEFILDIAVSNVNRKPEELNQIGNQYLVLDSTVGYEINMHDHIVDPDGEPVVFDFQWINDEVMAPFITSSGLIMKPLSLGSGTMNITATDIHGAVLETSFNVFVEHRVGIDDNEADNLLLYPNPATEVINLELVTELAQKAMVRITNTDGRVLKTADTAFAGKKLAIGIADLSPGLYFIEVINDNTSITQKFTKR